jgi:hypothetical protein
VILLDLLLIGENALTPMRLRRVPQVSCHLRMRRSWEESKDVENSARDSTLDSNQQKTEAIYLENTKILRRFLMISF